MIENSGLYRLAKKQAPQSVRNRMRSTVRFMVDTYAGLRGFDSGCALPDFLIVGAQKAGTTSLFNWLVESGFVQSPIVKEVGFFDARWNWPIKYRGYFGRRQEDCLVGEATPSYLAFPEVPERVAALLGSGCKIIVVLRDPVGRSVSHYFHERRLGYEKRDMYTALIEEKALIEEAFDSHTTVSRRRYILTHCSYIYRSNYSKRLMPWREHFCREEMLFIKSEDMFTNPREAVESVAKFLGVEIKKNTAFNPRNTNSYVYEDNRAVAYLEGQLSVESSNYKNWIY